MGQIKERGYQGSKEPRYTPQIAPPAVRNPLFWADGRKNTGNIIYAHNKRSNVIYTHISLYAYTASPVNWPSPSENLTEKDPFNFNSQPKYAIFLTVQTF